MSDQVVSVGPRWRTLLTPQMVLLQTGLGLLTLLLSALWLRIPDASATDVIGSVLLAVVIVGLAAAGETWLVLRFGGLRWSRRSALLGVGLWLGMALLWWGWSLWMTHLSNNTYLYASYLNSKLPHGVRVLLSYSRLTKWMDWLWTTASWAAGAVLAVPVVAVLLGAPLPQALWRVYRSGLWWLVLVLAIDAGVYGTGALLHWTPGHALGVEMVSLVLRLALVLLLDGAVVAVLLAMTIERMGELVPAQLMSDGTPLTSQPRTVDRP